MGQLEVLRKLTRLLSNDSPFEEEKDVVYFLVETRKALDHLRNGGGDSYSVLRFYCDWAVHTDKDRITEEIREIITAAERSRYKQKNEPLDGFIRMERLQAEMTRFIVENNLAKEDIFLGPVWSSFYNSLVRVLSDQPLNLRGQITSFRFIANEHGISIEYDTI